MIFDRHEFSPPPRIAFAAKAALAAGGLTTAAGLAVAPERTWASLLLAALFLVGLGLAGVFFVALQYAAGAGWSVALRRVPEAMAAALPVGGVLLGLVLVLKPSLYAWTGDLAPAAHFSAFKQAWLSRPFFLARSAAYLIVWSAMAALIVRHSRRQDGDGAVAHTQANVRLSIAFRVVFGLTFWLACFDWIMSLEPEWYSTIFGIYNFSGLFASGLAAMIVLLVVLTNHRSFRGVLTEAHLHDLGKLLFAFSTFWMYIWFSQYMLIWYANIPEETVYYVRRLEGAWGTLFLLNMLLNWAVPFCVLLARWSKRTAWVLGYVAAVILVGRWLDLYLMVAPPIVGAKPAFGIWETGVLLATLGLFGLVFLRALSQARVVPIRDPYLVESLHSYQ